MKSSAGLLMYKITDGKLKVFIVHPGGPFWKDKDEGAWSIPKGEIEEGEDALQCAIREMKEECGIDASGKSFIDLGMIRQKSGKKVYAWAFEGDWQGILMCSSYVNVEWPYKSGKMIRVPEIDKAGFYNYEVAIKKINLCQKEFLGRILEHVWK
jgi:predicted NUDIX family NTP pyrophosphohydrolase